MASLPDGAKQVLHVNNFNVDYRPDGSIQQFNSDLSVWDLEGHELQRNAIFVNKPLRCILGAYCTMAHLRLLWPVTCLTVSRLNSAVVIWLNTAP